MHAFPFYFILLHLSTLFHCTYFLYLRVVLYILYTLIRFYYCVHSFYFILFYFMCVVAYGSLLYYSLFRIMESMPLNLLILSCITYRIAFHCVILLCCVLLLILLYLCHCTHICMSVISARACKPVGNGADLPSSPSTQHFSSLSPTSHCFTS